jgi:glycosyltransferase involved in cell wall biosynthesis
VKRIDLVLNAVKQMVDRNPAITAAIVGDGPLRAELAALARDLGISANVEFAGSQKDVGAWLRRSRIFMLTSENEGLALSLMEAMSCGAVPIVANVGDLGDLVSDGINGHLVGEHRPEVFAALAERVLGDPARLEAFATASRSAASRHGVPAATLQWDEVLSIFDRAGSASGSVRESVPSPVSARR